MVLAEAVTEGMRFFVVRTGEIRMWSGGNAHRSDPGLHWALKAAVLCPLKAGVKELRVARLKVCCDSQTPLGLMYSHQMRIKLALRGYRALRLSQGWTPGLATSLLFQESPECHCLGVLEPWTQLDEQLGNKDMTVFSLWDGNTRTHLLYLLLLVFMESPGG